MFRSQVNCDDMQFGTGSKCGWYSTPVHGSSPNITPEQLHAKTRPHGRQGDSGTVMSVPKRSRDPNWLNRFVLSEYTPVLPPLGHLSQMVTSLV
eukprot:1186388-Prorocentrum_minimum.AAC.5